MPEQDRDAERVMMNMHSSSRIASSLLFADVEMIMRLWTFMKRMQREHILNKGEVENFEKFIKATQGKYNIYQIPITSEDKKIGNAIHMRSLKNQLNELKLRYHVLPDLNNEDGMAQIAVFREDQQKFSVWYGNYLNAHMSGGEKSVQDLNNLTNRHVSIISMPCEGIEQKLKEDFVALSINYSILPDLNVGDGNIQMYIANADLNKVEHWFKLYKDDQIKNGKTEKDIGEMKVVSQEDYQETGRLDEEEYISTGNEAVQIANEKYEGQEKGEIEKAVNQMNKTIRSKDDMSYQRYHSDPSFFEITINRESLVEKSHFSNAGKEKAEEKGLFVSRVPGTWGEEEQTLLLPKDRVYETDDGKTYIGFLKKDEQPIIMDIQNRQVNTSASKLYENTYEKVERGFKQKEQLAKEKGIRKDAKDISNVLSSEPAKSTGKGKDKFNNFQGRKYENINELEKMLLMKK